MNALAEAIRLTEQSEAADTIPYAQLDATLAAAYAGIAQAEALERIATAIENTFTRGELNVMLMNGQH